MTDLRDEDVGHRLRKNIEVHEVFTVRYLGWSGLKNGALLTTAEQNGVEVFYHGRSKLGPNSSLSDRRIAIVILSASKWPIIKNHIPAISAAIAIASAVPGSFQVVECGRFRKKAQRGIRTKPELE